MALQEMSLYGRIKSKTFLCYTIPASTRRCTNIGLMLGQRRRRWPNFNPTLVQRLVSTAIIPGKILMNPLFLMCKVDPWF